MLREWSDLPDKQGREASARLFADMEKLTARVAEVETELSGCIGKADGACVRTGPELARLLLMGRRERDKLFPRLFGEPAWDILLSLAALNPHKPHLAVSSVSYESGVPQTTTLRYLAMLETADLVERSTHPDDGRIVLVRLTDAGRERVQRLLETWPLALLLVALAPLALLFRQFL